jgi:hypothetical protein
MKKKIKKIFETGMILAVVLAFVIPGAASITKQTFSDAEIKWVPVSSSGSHTIIDNEIFLHETDKLVTLEIHVSGWDPHLLNTVQAAVDSLGYSNGVGDNLIPFGWPGLPEDGCFIDTSRSDYVFYGMTALDAVYTGDLNYMWGATLLFGGKADDSQTHYLGTLILEAPANAKGTYTIEFLPGDTKSFMRDDGGQYIIPLILTPVLITINQPPNAPIITGQTSGSVGTPYTYTFNATDPDSDDIAEYLVNWSDGTDETIIGPFASGSPTTASHTWPSQGSYVVRAMAKDVNGLISPIGSLSVSITPRSRTVTHPLSLSLLERFPNLFPIFRYILGLQ